MIEVPRSLLSEFFRMPEAEQVGVYFLFGEDEQDGAPKAYIGQTGTLRQRLSQHGQQKEFWNRALVAVSLTSSLTTTHEIGSEHVGTPVTNAHPVCSTL